MRGNWTKKILIFAVHLHNNRSGQLVGWHDGNHNARDHKQQPLSEFARYSHHREENYYVDVHSFPNAQINIPWVGITLGSVVIDWVIDCRNLALFWE